MVRPEKVIRVLNEAAVKFVVMGTHGITGYRDEARATQDVDVLVRARDHRKAVDALQRAYPKLQIQDTPVVTRFVDPGTGKAVIDLMKPCYDLYKQAFKNCVVIEDSYLIPDLEMALASKFAAMISPNRTADKKHLDAGDFINVVRKNHEAINLAKLSKLGELVYHGGGDELVRYVEDAKAGKTLEIW